jgi:hypothetical protein
MDDAERVIGEISSDICRGKTKNVIHVGKRGLFVNKRFTVYGGSQATIAERIGVSESTVRRRLSNAHRRKKNVKLCLQGKRPLSIVEKRQVFRLTDRISADKLGHAIHVADCEFATHDHAYLSKLYAHEGRVFEPRCNIYAFPVDIRPRKADKCRYKKFIGALNDDGLPTTA